MNQKIIVYTNKDLPYSTGNYTQYVLTTCNKNILKILYIYIDIYIDIYRYNWITLLYTWNRQNTVNQLYFNKI